MGISETKAGDRVSDWDIKTYEVAVALAKGWNDEYHYGETVYVPIDKGTGTSPRYGVRHLPQVGDEVSYGFNGDYYPDGEIARITASGRVITTTGNVYYPVATRERGRVVKGRRTGGYLMKGGTWSLVKGHHDERNPSF